MSTMILPDPLNGHFTTLSSVATYQSKYGTVLADLLGVWTPWSSNLFPLFQFNEAGILMNESSSIGKTDMPSTLSPGGLTCAFGLENHDYFASGFFFDGNNTYFLTGGNLSLVCVSIDVLAAAAYDASALIRNTGSNTDKITGLYTGKKCNPALFQISLLQMFILLQTDSGNNSSIFTAGQIPSGLSLPHSKTDFSIFPLLDPSIGVAYLSSMGRINLAKFWSALEPTFVSERSEPIPYPQFSLSTQDHFTTLYAYYQVNATTMAEVTFDLDSGFWSLHPTYIHIDLLI